MRLFAGIPLSPHAVERLSAVRLRLAAPGDGLRWSLPEQWHITLQFFGDVEPGQVGAITSAMQNVIHPPVALRVDALGRFSAKGILFAAVVASEELRTFRRIFAEAVAPFSSASASLPFHPHITLARSKGRAGLRALERLSTPELPHLGTAVQWTAMEVHFYESVPGAQGTVYRSVAVHALRAG